jgi:hypothetical protein
MDDQTEKTKVFGIGLNKTGTTTLGRCGKLLGYRYKGCDRSLLEDLVKRKDFTRTREVAQDFDLFEDWPWPLFYKELDQMFPGSKFILTVRKDANAWLASLKKHSMRTRPLRNCRKLAYGHHYPARHEAEFLACYRNHNDAVRAYFADRKDDFLEICWEDGHGWDELCGFLGVEKPDVPIPHANKGAGKRPKRVRLVLNRLLSAIAS